MSFDIIYIYIPEIIIQNERNKIKIALAFSLPVFLICIGISNFIVAKFSFGRDLPFFLFSIGSMAKGAISLKILNKSIETFYVFIVRITLSLI